MKSLFAPSTLLALAIVMLGSLAMLSAGFSDEADREVDWYDCSGKEDGNYPHPSDCTKFMTCVARKHAYERNCPACDASDKKNCPRGRFQYNQQHSACQPAPEAGCVTEKF